MRIMRFGLRKTSRDRPVGKGRVMVNPSPGLLGIGVYRTAGIYTLEGLKALADLVKVNSARTFLLHCWVTHEKRKAELSQVPQSLRR